MLAICRRDGPSQRHLGLLKHRLHFSLETDIQQSLRPCGRERHRPDSLAVGGPIESADSAPARHREVLLGSVHKGYNLDDRYGLTPCFLCQRQLGSVGRQTPVEVVRIGRLDFHLRDLLRLSLQWIKSEESFLAWLNCAQKAHGRG